MADYELTDLNGTVWDFNDSRGLVDLKYVKGLDGADFKLATLHGVNQRGVTVVGSDFEPGKLSLGVQIQPYRQGIRGADAVAILADWRDGIGEGEGARDGNEMRFRVVDTNRWQAVRCVTKPPADWEGMRISGNYLDEVVFQSDESDWRTDPLEYTFTAAQFAGAAVANPGTVDSWPWFRLTGPITTPTLGIAGEAVALPTLTGGQWLTIETDPNWYAVTDQDGVDKTFTLTAMAGSNDDRWRTPAAARDESIPVTITGTGTTGATKLEVVVPQIYRSAL
ncbi:hypothetical protein [Gordonia sp. NPDC003376]